MRAMFMGGMAGLFVISIAACQSSPPASVPVASSTSAPSPVSPVIPTQIVPASSWLEVDLAKQTVSLHDDGKVVAEYAASTGVTSDRKYATPPGVYRIQSKDKGPVESSPGVFVSDVVMFDIRLGNGFHSRPMDAQGHILDATLGKPTTAGCVRVGESARLFEFAQLGMWVWIH